MTRRLVTLTAALAIAGCCHRPPKPPPIRDCDASALRVEMGTGQPDFRCPIPVLVSLIGESVRQAKAKCDAFIAFDGDWSQRVKNWDRLLGEVITQAQSPGGQHDLQDPAKVARNRAAVLPLGTEERRLGLQGVIDSVLALEAKAGLSSPPVPDCEP